MALIPEKEMATHSSILPWRIPWTEKHGRLYSPWCRKESDTTEQLTHTHMALVWQFLRKLKTELPYDSAIPLLGIYPKKTNPQLKK